MGLIIWIVIGGVIGWLASLLMNVDDPQHIYLNTGLGVGGSLLGGWLLGPLFGSDGGGIVAGEFTLASLFVSTLGSVLLVAFVNLALRGRAR